MTKPFLRSSGLSNQFVLSVWLVMLSTVLCWGQSTPKLSGRVLEQESGKPIPFATVYINATTKGTTADADGRYQLASLPAGPLELVTSAVGYVTNRQKITAQQASREIIIKLAPDTQSLAAVMVTAPRSKAYNRQLRTFKRELLGDTPFADKCTFGNLDALTLYEQNGHLMARGTEPLLIDNQALGYRIHYTLLHFDTYRGATYYAGTTRFEEIKPESPKQADRWKWNRQLAYRGSSRHLLASLATGTYQKEGYMIYQADFVVPQNPAIPLLQFVTKQPGMVVSDSVIKPTRVPQERQLISPKALEIFYTRRRSLSSPYPKIPYAYSLLILPQKHALITTDGWILQPNGLEIRGEMSSNRLSNLLPIDWTPIPAEFDSTEQVITKGLILKPDNRLDSIANRAIEFQQIMAPALFVQTDKGYYLTGDHLWMSGYVMAPQTWLPLTNRPDGNPEIIQVELINPSGKPVLHQWLAVAEGRFVSDFHLSDSLKTGLYTLRAYPSADPSVRPAFERTILITNAVEPPIPFATTQTDSLDLQFLPEGGQWVTSLPAKLGVKVVNRQGRGVSVEGEIQGSDGAPPIRFSTDEWGFGMLTMTPAKNVSYTALTGNKTTRQRVELPPVMAEGLTLSVDPLTDTTQLAISIRATANRAESPVYITLQSRGQLIQQTKIKLQNAFAQLLIPADRIPAGLGIVTLFDSLGNPRAERLIFGHEQVDTVQYTLTTDKPLYKPRETVSLTLQLANAKREPVAVIGSVAVVDADQLPPDEGTATIATHLLLTGDLRGRVEQPNRYLRDRTPSTRLSIEKLLLTQGWRRIHQQSRADSVVFSQGIALSGQVFTRRNRPIPQANLFLRFANRSGILYARTTRTDLQGRFRLDGLDFADTVQVRTRVMNENFKPMAAVVILDAPGQPYSLPKTRNSLDVNSLQQYRQLAKNRQAARPGDYREPDARLLREVTVRAARYDEVNARRVSYHGQPDAVVRFDEKSRSYANAYEMISNKVVGVQVQRNTSGDFGSGGYTVRIRGAVSSRGTPSPPLYLLDGSYVHENESGNALFMINPAEIERIEVIKNAGGSIYGSRGGDGVIAFYSKKWTPTTQKEPLLSSESEQTLYGFPIQRQFYTPRYPTESGEPAPGLDRRDVLYWRPIIATDFRGETTLQFSLSDSVRQLRVTVQGLTTAGQPFAVEKTISVQ